MSDSIILYVAAFGSMAAILALTCWIGYGR